MFHTRRPPSHLFALATSALLGAAILPAAPACVRTADGLRLAPKAEQGILTADAVLCDALVPLVGLDAFACAGEEAAMKAILDRVTAKDADKRLAPVSTAKRAVYRRGGRGMVGYVPAHLAAAVQAEYDAVGADAGPEGGR